MKTIIKLPILTMSFFIILIGIFILIYNLGLIKQDKLDFLLRLWPVILIISGAFLYINSLQNRRHYKLAKSKQKDYEFQPTLNKKELQLKLSFAYGDLWLGSGEKNYKLITEQAQSLSEPEFTQLEQDNTPSLSILMNKPIFPSPIPLKNIWKLFCNPEDTLHLDIDAHEANLNLDLTELKIESFNFKGNTGYHEIMFGEKQNKLKGKIYSSSTSLSILFSANVLIKLKLMNHFCRINYPQGDFIKQENGIFVHQNNHLAANKIIELTVDGPLKILNIDFKEPISLKDSNS
jgi:hypothetical protein